jgi:hypothetical protein
MKATTRRLLGASKVNKHWGQTVRKAIAKDYRTNRNTARSRILKNGTGV